MGDHDLLRDYDPTVGLVAHGIVPDAEEACSNCGGWGKISNLNRRQEETLHTCHVCQGTGSAAPTTTTTTGEDHDREH